MALAISIAVFRCSTVYADLLLSWVLSSVHRTASEHSMLAYWGCEEAVEH